MMYFRHNVDIGIRMICYVRSNSQFKRDYEMSRMFGERINEFVLSTDIMDHETFMDLLKLIQTYVNEHLDVAYFSVLDETTINDQQGLQTLWSTREAKPSYTVDKESGYSSHTAYTFGENKPIWVVSDSKDLLHKADNLKDMWSGSEDFPLYSTGNQDEIRTSVMHPLRKDGRPIGVVEFAADRYVEPTPASLEEVRMLAAVLSRAHQMYDTRRVQRENTKRAMKMLEGALKTQSWTRLALPQLFVAYSGVERLETEARAEHEAVIETIREVIGQFSGILKAVYWEDATEAGNIANQVIRDIGNSEFGICYFSEPTKDGQFQDNANVLFEAGMMQALTNSTGAHLKAWIPIREKESTSIPFDIASERLLLVDREDGKLDKTSFAEALRLRVAAFLESSTSKD